MLDLLLAGCFFTSGEGGEGGGASSLGEGGDAATMVASVTIIEGTHLSSTTFPSLSSISGKSGNISSQILIGQQVQNTGIGGFKC